MDKGQKDIAAVIPPSFGGKDLSREFSVLRKTLLADLNLPEELRAFQASLLSELKQQTQKYLRQCVLQEVNLQQESIDKQLFDIKAMLKLELERQRPCTPTGLMQQQAQYTQQFELQDVVLQEAIEHWITPRDDSRCLRLREATPPVPEPYRMDNGLHAASTFEVAAVTSSKIDNQEHKLCVKVTPPMVEQELQPKKKHTTRLFEDEIKSIQIESDTSMASFFFQESDIATPPYHVEDYYKKTGIAQFLARSCPLRWLSNAMVVANAAWIGIEAEHSPGRSLYTSEWIIVIVAQTFVLFFAFEWLVRFCAFRETKDVFRDAWMKTDTSLLVVQILDVWGLEVILHFAQSDSVLLKLAVGIRIARVLKLSRMLRIIQLVPTTVAMIRGVWKAFGTIFSTLLLIALMVYVWAILIHGLLRDDDVLNKALFDQSYLDFTTMPRSMWTLLMDGSLLLDNAAPLMTQLVFSDEKHQVVAGMLFTLFALLSAYLILQMLIGVLCDVVTKINEEHREAQASAVIKAKLLKKLNEMHDGSGKLTRDELFHIMADEDSVAVLKHLKINRLFLMQLQETVFETSAETRITIKQALEMMLLCRSENPANVEVLAGGFCFIANQLRVMQEQLQGTT